MTMKFKEESFSNTVEILMYPDHYVADAHTFLKDDAAAVAVGAKKIIKAGTVYPANTDKAIGVLLTDVDVTDGDASGALVVHGFIDASKMPAQPSSAAQGVLKLIKFYNATAASALPIANGGTGATSLEDAKTNLEIA